MRDLYLRRVLLVVALLGGSWFGGSWWGVMAAVVAVTLLGAGVPPRLLPLLGAATLSFAALVWVGGTSGAPRQVSFDLVTAHPWPGRLALIALVFMASGLLGEVWRDGERRDA